MRIARRRLSSLPPQGYPSQTVIGRSCPVGGPPDSAHPTGGPQPGYCGSWECWCDCMWDPLVNPAANGMCKSKPGLALALAPWLAGGAQHRGIPILDTTAAGDVGTGAIDVGQIIGSVFHMPATIVGPSQAAPYVSPVTEAQLAALRAGASVGIRGGLMSYLSNPAYLIGGALFLVLGYAILRPRKLAPVPATPGGA